MKDGKFLLWAATVWSLVFSFLIWIVFRGHLLPETGTVARAIISTAMIMGLVGSGALVHTLVQIALMRFGPEKETRVEWLVDGVSSGLPLLTAILTKMYMWGAEARVEWWSTFAWWITTMIALSLVIDIVYTIVSLRKKEVVKNVTPPTATP